MLRARRAGYDPALGTRLADQVLAGIDLPAAAIVAGYWPLPGEIDVRPLLLALGDRGHPLALPQTPPPGAPLVFHRWHPGDPLHQGRFRTRHPVPDPAAAAVVPDVILVPLLGFDRAGHRLGYGAGYYDRTLARLPHALTIGCAYAAQEIPAVPAEPYDHRLHAIATEDEIIIIASPR